MRRRFALEVAEIHGIEAHQVVNNRQSASVSGSPHEKPLIVQPRVQLIQRVEQRPERVFVGLLACGKARPVNAIVHVGVDRGVELVDLRAQRFRIEIQRGVAELVKGPSSTSDDLGRLIGNDGLALLVPKHGHVTRPE
jgi:hypothetical protein